MIDVYTSSVVERPVQVTIRGQHANREMTPVKTDLSDELIES